MRRAHCWMRVRGTGIALPWHRQLAPQRHPHVLPEPYGLSCTVPQGLRHRFVRPTWAVILGTNLQDMYSFGWQRRKGTGLQCRGRAEEGRAGGPGPGAGRLMTGREQASSCPGLHSRIRRPLWRFLGLKRLQCQPRAPTKRPTFKSNRTLAEGPITVQPFFRPPFHSAALATHCASPWAVVSDYCTRCAAASPRSAAPAMTLTAMELER